MHRPLFVRHTSTLCRLLFPLVIIASGCSSPTDPLEAQEDMPRDLARDPARDLSQPDTEPDQDELTTPHDQGTPPTADAAPDLHTLPDATTDMPEERDLGTPAPPLDAEVRNYIFGHSLILHSDTANVPRWLQALATEAGHAYGMSGQYGFADTHASNLPPFAQWGVSGVDSIWSDDSGVPFEDVDVDTVLFTEANFRQHYPADVIDPDGFLQESTVTSTLAVFDWVARHEPGVRFILYENWPDMGNYTAADFETTSPSPQELQAYNAYTRGDFHSWWIAYRDAMQNARPAMTVHLIPVGSIMADVLEQELSDIPSQALYEDNAPHGTSTLYYIAGLITYMGIYGEQAPLSHEPPDDVHPLARERRAAIIAHIWSELRAFNNDADTFRVWGAAR